MTNGIILFAQGISMDLNMAAIRFEKGAQGIDGSAFSCPIGPEECEQFAGFNIKTDALYGMHGTIGLM